MFYLHWELDFSNNFFLRITFSKQESCNYLFTFGILFHVSKLTDLSTFLYEVPFFQKQPPEVFYIKKIFLKTSQNSQKKTCVRVSFLFQHRCFLVNIAKFLRISFFTEHLRWLFLSILNPHWNSIEEDSWSHTCLLI